MNVVSLSVVGDVEVISRVHPTVSLATVRVRVLVGRLISAPVSDFVALLVPVPVVPVPLAVPLDVHVPRPVPVLVAVPVAVPFAVPVPVLVAEPAAEPVAGPVAPSAAGLAAVPADGQVGAWDRYQASPYGFCICEACRRHGLQLRVYIQRSSHICDRTERSPPALHSRKCISAPYSGTSSSESVKTDLLRC